MNRKFYPVIMIFAIFLMLPGTTAAAQTLLQDEIVVYGERELSPDERLDIKDVRETPARDVGEALKTIDGISFIRKGVIANDIILRGFQRDNINVLIDGMKLYGACPNRMDAACFHVDFSEIQDVTVLKGPFDVKNAGSLGGVVNINTKTPEKGYHGDINAFAGSYENIGTSVNGSYGSEKGSAAFGYAYKYALPFEDGHGNRITEIYPDTDNARYQDGEINDNAYQINTFWTKIGVNPNANQRFTFGYSGQDADDVIYPYLLMDADYDDTDRVNATYRISGISNVIKKITIGGYWNQVKHLMTDNRRVSSSTFSTGYMMKTYAETETYGGNVAVSLNILDGDLDLGADYFLRNWDADTTLPNGTWDSVPDVDLWDTGAFFTYNRNISDKSNLTAGARIDYVNTEAGTDRSDFYLQYHDCGDTEKEDVLGSGNMQVLYAPVPHLQIFAGIGVSMRAPDPVERYFALSKPMTKPNWVGRPDLDPSKNREFDLSVRYAGDKFLAKATLFYSDVEDFITVYNAPSKIDGKAARSYRNTDAILCGGETTLLFNVTRAMTLEGGLAYTYGKDDTEDKPLFEIPPFSGRVAFRYDNERVFAGIENLFAAEQNRIDSDLNESKTKDWGILNFSSGIFYKQMKASFGVLNIFDRYYFEHMSHQRDPFRTPVMVPESGRSFYVNVSLQI